MKYIFGLKITTLEVTKYVLGHEKTQHSFHRDSNPGSKIPSATPKLVGHRTSCSFSRKMGKKCKQKDIFVFT